MAYEVPKYKTKDKRRSIVDWNAQNLRMLRLDEYPRRTTLQGCVNKVDEWDKQDHSITFLHAVIIL